MEKRGSKGEVPIQRGILLSRVEIWKSKPSLQSLIVSMMNLIWLLCVLCLLDLPGVLAKKAAPNPPSVASNAAEPAPLSLPVEPSKNESKPEIAFEAQPVFKLGNRVGPLVGPAARPQPVGDDEPFDTSALWKPCQRDGAPTVRGCDSVVFAVEGEQRTAELDLPHSNRRR